MPHESRLSVVSSVVCVSLLTLSYLAAVHISVSHSQKCTAVLVSRENHFVRFHAQAKAHIQLQFSRFAVSHARFDRHNPLPVRRIIIVASPAPRWPK